MTSPRWGFYVFSANIGGSFYSYDSNGEIVLFSKLKVFKLKEDIRVFTEETIQTEAISLPRAAL
jgi:hypothetical protein